MLFLSPGVITNYCLQTLFHWCDNNAVYTVDVPRVHANSLLRTTGKKQNQRVHTHCISENSQSGPGTKG